MLVVGSGFVDFSPPQTRLRASDSLFVGESVLPEQTVVTRRTMQVLMPLLTTSELVQSFKDSMHLGAEKARLKLSVFSCLTCPKKSCLPTNDVFIESVLDISGCAGVWTSFFGIETLVDPHMEGSNPNPRTEGSGGSHQSRSVLRDRRVIRAVNGVVSSMY